jgi:hypothetical protein
MTNYDTNCSVLDTESGQLQLNVIAVRHNDMRSGRLGHCHMEGGKLVELAAFCGRFCYQLDINRFEQ